MPTRRYHKVSSHAHKLSKTTFINHLLKPCNTSKSVYSFHVVEAFHPHSNRFPTICTDNSRTLPSPINHKARRMSPDDNRAVWYRRTVERTPLERDIRSIPKDYQGRHFSGQEVFVETQIQRNGRRTVDGAHVRILEQPTTRSYLETEEYFYPARRNASKPQEPKPQESKPQELGSMQPQPQELAPPKQFLKTLPPREVGRAPGPRSILRSPTPPRHRRRRSPPDGWSYRRRRCVVKRYSTCLNAETCSPSPISPEGEERKPRSKSRTAVDKTNRASWLTQILLPTVLTHMPGAHRPDGKGEVPGGLSGAALSSSNVLPVALQAINSFIEGREKKNEEREREYEKEKKEQAKRASR